MIKSIFSVKDIKLGVYNLPFYHDSRIQAIRQLKMALMVDSNLMLNRFPTDYELYEIGEWDDVTGQVNIFEDKKFVVTIKQLVEENEQEKVWKEVIREQTQQLLAEKAKREQKKAENQ